MPDVAFDQFPGLDLRSDPLETPAAVDVSNVVLQPGRFATRPGSTAFYAGSAGETYAQVKPTHDGTPLVIRTDPTPTIFAINQNTGAVITSVADGAPLVSLGFDTAIVRQISAGGAEVTYLSGGPTFQIHKWNGTVFSSPAGLAAVEGSSVAAWGNRLIVADATTFGRVLFSNAGDPETFGANDFVDFPEQVVGLVTWRESLFVFTPTRFHVFYGTTTDATGGAVFNYRTVDIGVGATAPSGSAGYNDMVTSGRDGVYFISLDGLYRTIGDTPVRVSDELASVWPLNGFELPAAYVSPSVFYGVSSVRDEVFVTTDEGTWVRGPVGWTHYSLPGDMKHLIPSEESDEVCFFTSGSTGMGLRKMEYDATTDAGTPIDWRYRSGWYDMGVPNSKRVGPVSLWGSGTLTVSVLADYGTTDANAGTVTLGTAPTVARARHLKTYRGRLLSHKLSGSGQAVVYRLSVFVRDQRVQ